MYPSRTPKASFVSDPLVLFCLMVLIGEVCKRCGFADKRALQIDHVDGDGYLDRRGKSGSAIYYHIIKEVEAGRGKRYQTLCANCNWIKRHKNKESSRRGRKPRR